MGFGSGAGGKKKDDAKPTSFICKENKNATEPAAAIARQLPMLGLLNYSMVALGEIWSCCALCRTVKAELNTEKEGEKVFCCSMQWGKMRNKYNPKMPDQSQPKTPDQSRSVMKYKPENACFNKLNAW